MKKTDGEINLKDITPKAPPLREAIRKLLARKSKQQQRLSLVEVCDSVGCSPKMALRELDALHESGYNLEFDPEQKVELSPTIPKQANVSIKTEDYFGDDWVRFGFVADSHMASKYSRLVVINAIYDVYEREGIHTVYHGGNWIDGDARFNKYDVHCVGFENQLTYFLKHYPKRKGITTHLISGDDHEGWYVQREQINVGRVMQARAKEEGRDDLVDLGYMERDLEFRRGAGSSVIRVIHAGGGSAYAISYTSQKYVECVPMDTEILTPTGWKTREQLEIGDVVMGYNAKSDICEWTPITGLNDGEGEVIRYFNDQFDVRCTANHRWAQEIEQRAGPNKRSKKPTPYSRRYRELAPIGHTTRRARIIQAARGVEGPGLPAFGFNDWLDRPQTVDRVLTMNSGERRAFIEGMLIGEGHRHTNQNGTRQLVFSQNTGPVLEGFRLACFLEGIATTQRSVVGGSYKPESKEHRRVALLRKRTRIVNKLQRESRGVQPIWCPTTTLGTWVMRQGDTISITGNSLQGGEKPAIVLVGHFHKFDWSYPREVHVVQGGCTQDQTPFMRKRRIQAMVGGCIIEAKQDRRGAFNRVRVEFMPFYDKKYYNYKW